MQGDKYDIIWKNVWNRIKTYDNIDSAQIDAFFSRLEPQAFSEGFMMLTADTEFICKWIETRYKNIICRALEELYHVPFNIAIEVDESRRAGHTPSYETSQPVSSSLPASESQAPTNHAPEIDQPTESPSNALTTYTFDNFVTGSSNRIAYSMALAVAEMPGNPELNPLFIYGKSGLGKTHLMRSIQNYIDTNYSYLNVQFVDTMEFVNDYTEAAISNDSKAFSKFKQRYDAADVLLIDDVQGLQHKEETLNMVFQIFNKMIDSGKQIVLSADRAPKHIDVDERYQSRFSSGGVQDIQPPEVETKMGIVRNYVEACKEEYQKFGTEFNIPPDVQEYIAQISSSNIRELKSAITKIIFYMRTADQETVSINEAKTLLDDHFSGGSNKRLAISDIQQVVEKYFNVSHAELVGKKRTQNIKHARQMAMYLCRTMIDVPFSTIGKEFNKDHSTVMYSVSTIEQKSTESREVYEELEILRQMILEQ